MFTNRIAWTLLIVVTFLLGSCQVQEPQDTPITDPETNDVHDYRGELIVSVWGGVTEEWIRAQVEPEFKKIYPNVTVSYDIGGMSARYNKLLAQKASPTIDLFISTGESLFAAINEGLLRPIDRANIPNMEYLHDWAVPAPEYGATFSAIAQGLGYNPDFFGDDPPTSWGDLWRPEVQGKISVPAFGHSQMPEFVIMAARLNGGDVDNIEPGLEYLAQLRPAAQTFFYTGWNSQFDSGDVVLAVDFDYYINAMADLGSNIKFVIPEEGAFGSLQHAAVVAGTDNPEMVETFINVMLSPTIQDSVANDLLNSPSRTDIQLSGELAERLVVYGESLEKVLWFDPAFNVEVRAEWTELLNENVAPYWGE